MLFCFLLLLKRDKSVWHLQPISSIWRPRPSCLLPSQKQKHMTLKVELHRLVGTQYATGEEQRNSSRRKEEAEPKWK